MKTGMENTTALASRMAIADVFDALVSERCYKDAMLPERAFEIICEEAGTHFDPNLAQFFLNHKDEFAELSMRKERNDGDVDGE